MIAKLPILGFTLVTALAGQAVAHEDCADHGQKPTTYRAPPAAPASYSTPAAHPGYRADGRYRDAAQPRYDYREAVNDLRQADSNRDGWVTLPEALRHGRRDFQRSDRDQNQVLTWREVPQQELAQEDRNRNGRVSYDEYQAAIRRSFARFDDNRDGVLASYELNQHNGARAAGWQH